MCSPADSPAPTPLGIFSGAVNRFKDLTPTDDIASAFEEVKDALLELVRTSPDPNAYTHSVSILRLGGPIEPTDLDKLQERVRYAYSLLP